MGTGKLPISCEEMVDGPTYSRLDWSTGACRKPARAANRGRGQRGVAVAHAAPCPKKWLAWSTGACRKPGREYGGALQLPRRHHVQKRRLAWSTDACRGPGRKDSEALRLHTSHFVQDDGQTLYVRLAWSDVLIEDVDFSLHRYLVAGQLTAKSVNWRVKGE